MVAALNFSRLVASYKWLHLAIMANAVCVANRRGTSLACTQKKSRAIALSLYHHASSLQTYGLTCPYKIVCDVAVLGNP